MSELETQIQTKRKEIHTDSYPMSIGEVINLYKDGDLDIHPEFQRVFRWSDVQKSRLIESVLLGIPLPSFFMAQRDDGVWDVVDGLQRLSTILSFVGVYRDENGATLPPLKLVGTDSLPSLEGMYWENEQDADHSFSTELQRAFKREKIDIKIVKKESDEQTRYELFQRLNTYGSSLSDQEVRNCLLLMINRDFYVWLKGLSEYPAFRTTIPLSSRLIDERYDLELVLRFFVNNNTPSEEFKGLRDVGELITKKMKDYAVGHDFDRDLQGDAFRKTFDILSAALGENCFRKYDGEKHTGAFSLSLFEIVATGVANNIGGLDVADAGDVSFVAEAIKQVPRNPEYAQHRGWGSELPIASLIWFPLVQHFSRNEPEAT